MVNDRGEHGGLRGLWGSLAARLSLAQVGLILLMAAALLAVWHLEALPASAKAAIVAIAVAVFGAASYLSGRALVDRPLGQLAGALRRIADERSLGAMPRPPTPQLVTVVQELKGVLSRLGHEHRERLDELLRERSKSEAILESVEDGLIVLDHERAVTHINEVARAILELADAEVAGRTLEQLAATHHHVARLLKAAARDDQRSADGVEFRLFVRGRDHAYLRREIPWLGPQGARLGTIVLLQDVTYVRDQERARTNLIATLSHELKTPLTSLAIGLELLGEAMGQRRGGREGELLDTIREDVGRLGAIANHLLDASRNSAARIGAERRAITLDGVVREACRPLLLQAREKRISLEVSSEGAERLPVWGDPLKLPWVVTNLVGNALRHTPAGGTIKVVLTGAGQVARLAVSDTGPGIDPQLLSRIFEPYAQFPDGEAEIGSAGLGLHIAKEIIEAHGGRIFVESKLRVGSTFSIELPLREEAFG